MMTPVHVGRRAATRVAPLAVLILALACGAAAIGAHAQARQAEGAGVRSADRDAGEIQILPVRNGVYHDLINDQFINDRVYMLLGAGANITAEISGEGIVLVDTGAANMNEKVLAALRRITDKQVWTIIDTSADADKTGGNAALAKAGSSVTRGGAGYVGAQIIAHENVANLLSAPDANVPEIGLPTDTYFQDQWNLPSFFYGDAIEMMHFPHAHTDGDTVVWFRHADVIATGDLFRTDTYPVIDLSRGGNVQGVLDGLNWVLDTAITLIRAEGGTLVIPGHGRLCDAADVAYYRDMVTIIRDRVRDMVKKGMTLEQVKSAKVTEDFDPRYGTNTGPWTTDMFVEAVYKSVAAAPASGTPKRAPAAGKTSASGKK